MIYDTETTLYRRLVACMMPAFDRKRAERIEFQEIQQYGHRFTHRVGKDSWSILNYLNEFADVPEYRVSEAMALSISASLCCRFCEEPRRRVSLRVCSGCAAARYCSRECQEADWSEHREVCSSCARPV